MPIDLRDIGGGDGSQGFVLQGEAAADASGIAVSSVGDINNDGFDDIIVGAYQADGPGDTRTSAGGSYVVFGKGGGFPALTNLSAITNGNGSLGFVLHGESAGDWSGLAVGAAGDLNGDGYADIILGVRNADGPADDRASAGASYVIFGKGSGFTAAVDLASISAGDGSQGFVLHGEDADDELGDSVASAGDINGDGYADLIIGAPLADGAGNNRNLAGETYVVFGKSGGFGGAIDASAISGGDGSLGFVIQGKAFEESGSSVDTAGDMNGDGFDDLLIGTSQQGTSYVVFGKASGFGSSFDLAAITAGDGSQGFVLTGDAGDRFGYVVASIGDLNGDGFDDIVVSASDGDGPADTRADAGDSYVVFGKASGFAATISTASIEAGDGSQGFVLYGEQAGDQISRLSSAGDVNGDGFDDLIVGSISGDGPANGRDWGGESYVIFGKAGGFGAAIDLAAIAAGNGGFVIYGEQALDFAGAVSSAGDVNGDGFDDLLVGADGANNTAQSKSDVGNTYVIYGAATIGGSPNHLTQVAGGDGNDLKLGTAGADVLIGGRDDDTFISVGGADVMRGGEGDDRFWMNDATFARLDGGTGQDELRLFGAMTLTDEDFRRISDIETIVLIDQAVNLTLGRNAAKALGGVASNDFRVTIDATQSETTTQVIDATNFNQSLAVDFSNNTVGVTVSGGLRDDEVTGGSANDTLDGGRGVDTLAGRAGNDVYYVDNLADVVIEATGGGNDRVSARADFALGTGQEVELLTTTNYGAVRNIDLKGNEFAQTIVGNNGANWLHDGGVGGADTLAGRGGNDYYTVYNSGAAVIDGRGQGDFDRVAAGVDYALGASVEIESLRTTSLHAAYAINLTGNELGQQIIGNDGDNRIDGKDGRDTIQIGLGNDTIVFSTALKSGNVDTIIDFDVDHDRIELSGSIFGGLALGALDTSAFKDNAAAPRDADDHIIYNSNTGSLFYDADGTGGIVAVKFASLGTGLALTAADFVVI